jgi:predicted phosphodiesterase
VKIAVISDIHANWPALVTILETINSVGVDRVFCAGDVIGYYTQPVRCLEKILELKIPTIRGNHERMVLGEIEGEIQPSALKVIDYTREQLSARHIATINSWKNILKVPKYFLMVHGSPRNKDEYLQKPDQFSKCFSLMHSSFAEFKLCFFGHTHLTMVASEDEGIIAPVHEDRCFQLKPDRVYFINPGSVGQPRDGCNLASFIIYDSKRLTIQYYRRSYDLAQVVHEIGELGFPQRLAERLQGGW